MTVYILPWSLQVLTLSHPRCLPKTAAGKMETREIILQHYVQLVRENLHVVLAMSPIGAGFRNRCRMFPSLVNCCTIDWFNAWPEDALYSVAHRLLSYKSELGLASYVAPLCKAAGNKCLDNS